jgi:uncharacterized protein
VLGDRNPEFEDLMNMWTSADEKKLVSLTQTLAVNPEYYKALIEDRNTGMVSKIEGYLNSEETHTYFVVVGALHMLGDDGIVTQLEKAGYTVEKQ